VLTIPSLLFILSAFRWGGYVVDILWNRILRGGVFNDISVKSVSIGTGAVKWKHQKKGAEKEGLKTAIKKACCIIVYIWEHLVCFILCCKCVCFSAV